MAHIPCTARIDHLPATFADSYPLSCCNATVGAHRARDLAERCTSNCTVCAEYRNMVDAIKTAQ